MFPEHRKINYKIHIPRLQMVPKYPAAHPDGHVPSTTSQDSLFRQFPQGSQNSPYVNAGQLASVDVTVKTDTRKRHQLGRLTIELCSRKKVVSVYLCIIVTKEVII